MIVTTKVVKLGNTTSKTSGKPAVEFKVVGEEQLITIYDASKQLLEAPQFKEYTLKFNAYLEKGTLRGGDGTLA
jgi:hypothetical protein